MNSKLIIGQYVPGQSVVHRLDPRMKIALIFLFVIIVFFANTWQSYLSLTVFSLLTLLLTKIPVRFILKGLFPVWILIIFTFTLHLIVTKDGNELFNIFGFKIYTGGVIQGFAISLRFFLLILVTSLLTLTTTPIEITDAIETILHPLKKIKFPVHEIALMMSISLRFIPTLMQETDKISKAQASRGLDFRTGPIKERVRAVIPLLIPLFISAFKRAEDLAMAMEARGYHGDVGRTKLRELHIQRRDIVALLTFLLFVTLMLLTREW